MTIPEINQTIDKLKNLEPGWDGYKGKPVTENAAILAKKAAEALYHDFGDPQVVPGPGGDLQLEWHKETFTMEVWLCAK